MNPGYYLPQFNFSVEHYGGQWVMRVRSLADSIATTEEQCTAVLAWAASNRRKA